MRETTVTNSLESVCSVSNSIVCLITMRVFLQMSILKKEQRQL